MKYKNYLKTLFKTKTKELFKMFHNTENLDKSTLWKRFHNNSLGIIE